MKKAWLTGLALRRERLDFAIVENGAGGNPGCGRQGCFGDVRDDMKAMREKAKLLAAKEKARKPSVAKTASKANVAMPKRHAAKPKHVLTQKLVPRAVEVPETA